MSNSSSLQAVLSNAEKKEKEYDWISAVESYRKALGFVLGQDSSRLGDIYERLGYALHRVAMMSESVEQFRVSMCRAAAEYEKAKEFYDKTSSSGKTPRALRCDGMIAYMGYWLASEVSEKKRLIDECWKLAKDCLGAFHEAGDGSEFRRTYNQLSMSVDLGFFFEWDFQARERMMREALEYGERAIAILSTAEDPFELARTYVRTATFQEVFGHYFVDLVEKEKYSQKARDYVQKGKELSEEAAMIELPTVLFGSGPSGYWGEGTDLAVGNFEKALECGRKTKDKFTIGRAMDLLAYHVSWQAIATEDPDEMAKLRKLTLKYAEDAKRQYCPISFTSPRGGTFWVEAPYPDYYWWSAYWETSHSKKREFLEKALQAAPELLNRAENSGYPDVIGFAQMAFGNTLSFLAKLIVDPEEKQSLLEEALVHMNESIRIRGQIEPLAYWNRGMAQIMRANARSDLADLVKENETKKSMFEEAAQELESSLQLCTKEAVHYEKEISIGLFGSVGLEQYGHGKLLGRLYELTKNSAHLRSAIEAFDEAAETFQKLGLTTRMAESRWKAGQVCDSLGNHTRAAENFGLASNSYGSAGEKIPQLKDFYKEHAHYMEAWSEIERARHHHARQEYGLAKDHFEKAANLHKSLDHWGYLAPNYSAWAELDHAEDLSRNEQCEEAIKGFEQAASLFNETQESLHANLRKIEDQDEKQMATDMLKTSHQRHQYCIGRIALEEAKVLDRKGEHQRSSAEYGSAGEALESLALIVESEQEKNELGFIASLSRAWQKMMQAEAEASPALYLQASELFEKAKELNPNEKGKMLVLGHSRFCRALEAGTRFADTQEIADYTKAMQYLMSASNYYLKADFQSASEYTKATRLLFDAYVHMGNAARETDPEKKTRLYLMAEKVLQTSADSYIKAGSQSRSDQVLRLLETAREQREFAISLSELMNAPIIASTTAFTSPVSNFEKAVGLERFEHAEIQASIILSRRHLRVGEILELEIELANVGRGAAQLDKIAEAIPESFEITKKPETCRIENCNLNMRGRRLDASKIEELKLALKPKHQGTFRINPRILYLDEEGRSKSHEPEPLTVTVKELGIRGWIKGEG